MIKLVLNVLKSFGLWKPKEDNAVPKGRYVGKEDPNRPYRNYEPLKVSKKATIQYFLWKPTSYGKSIPVISIGCDGVPRTDIFLEMETSDGEIIPIVNNAATGRSGNLDNLSYAKINFQPRVTQDYLHKYDDVIAVRFYVKKKKNRKVYLKILNHGTRIVIPNISEKYDLK